MFKNVSDLVHVSGIIAAGDWAKSKQGQVHATYSKFANAPTPVDIDKGALSVVDTDVQARILESIGQTFPKQFHLIAEESNDEIDALAKQYFLTDNSLAENDLTLLIDPIDGTANYLSISPGADQSRERNQDFWAVSLCLLRGSEPIMGVMYYPNLGIILTAEKGHSAFINNQRAQIPSGIEFNPEHPMRVSHGVGDTLKSVKNKIRRQIRTGSLCVTFLSLLKHSVNEANLSSLPDCYGYIADNTFLTDLGVGPLAWTEAGGVIMDMNGDNVNPFAHILISHEGPRTHGAFFVVPSREYGEALLKYIIHHPVPSLARDGTPLLV